MFTVYIGLSNPSWWKRSAAVGWAETAHCHCSCFNPKPQDTAVGRGHIGSWLTRRETGAADSGQGLQGTHNDRGVASVSMMWIWNVSQLIFFFYRLSAIKNADRILMIESGRVVESGTHESLMGAKGQYFTMMRGSNAEEVIDTNNLAIVDNDKSAQLDKVVEKQLFPQSQQIYESTHSGRIKVIKVFEAYKIYLTFDRLPSDRERNRCSARTG